MTGGTGPERCGTMAGVRLRTAALGIAGAAHVVSILVITVLQPDPSGLPNASSGGFVGALVVPDETRDVIRPATGGDLLPAPTRPAPAPPVEPLPATEAPARAEPPPPAEVNVAPPPTALDPPTKDRPRDASAVAMGDARPSNPPAESVPSRPEEAMAPVVSTPRPAPPVETGPVEKARVRRIDDPRRNVPQKRAPRSAPPVGDGRDRTVTPAGDGRDRSVTPAEADAAGAAAGSSRAVVGGSGSRSGPEAAIGTSLAAYAAAVATEIAGHKYYPPAARGSGAAGAVTVVFTIGPNGTVVSHAISRSSGFPDLDATIPRMMSATRVPPPPNGRFRGSVTLRFSVNRSLR